MTMVMLTGAGDDARARARHDGKPAGHAGAPVEVMLGKILPYVVIGYLQLGVILGAAWLLFEVPMRRQLGAC